MKNLRACSPTENPEKNQKVSRTKRRLGASFSSSAL